MSAAGVGLRPRGRARQGGSRARAGARGVGGLGGLNGFLALGYVLVGLALATALAWPIYDTWRLALVAAVGGAVGVGLVVIARLRRWPWFTTVLAVAIAYVVGVVPLAVPSDLAGPMLVLQGVRDGLVGIVLGWKQLVTLDLPLGQYQAVLAPFLLIALAGSACAAALALSERRSAELAAPIVLAWGVFGVAFADTDPGAPFAFGGITVQAPREVLFGTLLVLVSLAWLLLRARLRRRAALAVGRGTTSAVLQRGSVGSTVRRRMLGAALLVVALAAGVAALPATSDVTLRSTLRTGAEPQLVLNTRSSPLSSYRAAFETANDDAPMFSVSGDLGGIDRLPLAVLGSWNGQVFSVGTGTDTRFTRVPGGTAPADAHRVTVTIQSDQGIWMPMPSGVQSAPVFSGPRANALADAFYLDRDSGAAIDVAGSGSARGLEAGDSYTVEAPATASVPLGDPGSGSELNAQSYPQLTAWVKAQDEPRTAAGFDELISRLRARGYLSHSVVDDSDAATWIAALKASAPSFTFQSSYAGHSQSRIESLFEQLNTHQKYAVDGANSAALVAAVGDDEQFAAAGALLARDVGYDSRVVLGVRLTSLDGSGVPACTGECTGGDLAAWIQVKSPTSSQWTTIDVEPQYTTPPMQVRVGEQFPKNPTVPEQNQASTAQQPDSQHSGNSVTAHAAHQSRSWLAVLLPVLRDVGLGLLVLLLVVLPALAIAFAKAARRARRRGEAVPEVAIVGAWAEASDSWADARIAAPGQTRTAQAAAVGSEPALRLAMLVDAAVFAPHPPLREAADDAWRLVDEERGRISGEVGIWARIVRAVSLRSVLAPLAGLARRSLLRGRPRPRRALSDDATVSETRA